MRARRWRASITAKQQPSGVTTKNSVNLTCLKRRTLRQQPRRIIKITKRIVRAKDDLRNRNDCTQSLHGPPIRHLRRIVEKLPRFRQKTVRHLRLEISFSSINKPLHEKRHRPTRMRPNHPHVRIPLRRPAKHVLRDRSRRIRPEFNRSRRQPRLNPRTTLRRVRMHEHQQLYAALTPQIPDRTPHSRDTSPRNS